MSSESIETDLTSYLRTCHKRLTCLSEGDKYVIVSGNEACDLDSVACSLAYAYFKQKKLGSSTTVLPLCNIRRRDMRLRTDVTFWLDECRLRWHELIFLDDLLKPWSITSSDQTCSGHLILVDHHAPTGYLAKLNDRWPLAEVIDHHQPATDDLIKVGAVGGLKKIEPVGSCASLVAMQLFLDDTIFQLPSVIWKLLYGAILIDTVGISELGRKAGRLTDLDWCAANRIEDIISDELFGNGLSREDLFRRLDGAKFDVSNLSTQDLLQRDFKMARIPEDESLSFICCTISGCDFQMLLCRPDFVTTSSQFCIEHSASLLIGITVGCPTLDTSVKLTELASAVESRRYGLFIFKPPPMEDTIGKELVTFLGHASSKLMLCSEPLANDESVDGVLYTGIICNRKATRKTVLPLLVQFLRQWHQQQQSSNNFGIAKSDDNVSTVDSSGGMSKLHKADYGANEGSRNGQYDQFITSLAPPLAKLGGCLTDWLAPLTPERRALLFRASSLTSDTTSLTPTTLTALYKNRDCSLKVDRNSKMKQVGRCAFTATSGVCLPPLFLPKNVPIFSHSRRTGAKCSMEYPRAVAGLSAVYFGRRQTVPDCDPGMVRQDIRVDHISPRREPIRRFKTSISDKNCSGVGTATIGSLSDGDIMKPSWLETEYLSKNGSWLQGKIAYNSLDAVEGASFSLFSRLSYHQDAYSEEGHGACKIPSNLSTSSPLPTDSSGILSTALKPAEIALWQTSMKLKDFQSPWHQTPTALKSGNLPSASSETKEL